MGIKYTPELTKLLSDMYTSGSSVPQIAEALKVHNDGETVPERSIIAKLASLGVYKKKVYTTKRGEIPVKKEEYIDRIAQHLNVSVDILESLEKVNKNVLALLDQSLAPKTEDTDAF